MQCTTHECAVDGGDAADAGEPDAGSVGGNAGQTRTFDISHDGGWNISNSTLLFRLRKGPARQTLPKNANCTWGPPDLCDDEVQFAYTRVGCWVDPTGGDAFASQLLPVGTRMHLTQISIDQPGDQETAKQTCFSYRDAHGRWHPIITMLKTKIVGDHVIVSYVFPDAPEADAAAVFLQTYPDVSSFSYTAY